MTLEILDPTYGDSGAAAGGTVEFAYAQRLQTLAGATIGIISNGKQGTRPFFAAMEDEFRTTFGVAEVVQVTKPNYSAPAGDEIIDRARAWTALVSGIGD